MSLNVSKEWKYTSDIFIILPLCLRVVGEGIQAKQQWLVSAAHFLFLPLLPSFVMLNPWCLSVNKTVFSFDPHYDQPTLPCLTFQSHPRGTWKASRSPHCEVEKTAKSLSGVRRNIPWFLLALSLRHVWVALLDFNELRFILGTGCHSKQTKKTDGSNDNGAKKQNKKEMMKAALH